MPPRARNQPEPRLGQADLRFQRDDAQVAGERELEPAAQAAPPISASVTCGSRSMRAYKR